MFLYQTASNSYAIRAHCNLLIQQTTICGQSLNPVVLVTQVDCYCRWFCGLALGWGWTWNVGCQ